MFTNKYLFLLAGAAILTSGCKNEEVGEEYQSEATELTATFAGANNVNGLKTTLVADGNKYKGSWMLNDTVLITDFTNASKYYTKSEGTVVATLGRVAGEEKIVINGPKLAFYPGEIAEWDGADGFNIYLPAEQMYSADGTVADDSYPMIAKSADGNLGFYNVCGVLRVSVKCEIPTVITSLKFRSREYMTYKDGNVKFIDEIPVLTMPELASGKVSTVSLNLGEGVVVGPTAKYFYIVIPPHLYKGGKRDDGKNYNEVIVSFKDAGDRSYGLIEDMDIQRSSVYGLSSTIDIVVGSGIEGNTNDNVD